MCFIIHKWGSWTKSISIGRGVYQFKRCVDCNLVRKRKAPFKGNIGVEEANKELEKYGG